MCEQNESLKQDAKSERICWYEKRQRSFERNKQCDSKHKRILSRLRSNKIEINTSPTAKVVEEYYEVWVTRRYCSKQQAL